MVVLGIISLLAAIALPAFKRVQQAARATAVANDLRVFSTAFLTYAQQTGGYPPDTGIGVMPPLMRDALRSSSWLGKTPIGGLYNWEYNRNEAGTKYRAGIALRTKGTNKVSNDRNQLLAIARIIDDGDITAGNFFLGAGNEPVYIIER